MDTKPKDNRLTRGSQAVADGAQEETAVASPIASNYNHKCREGQAKPTATAWWREFVEMRAWDQFKTETLDLLHHCVNPRWSDDGTDVLILDLDSNLTMNDGERIRETVAKLRPYWPFDLWDIDHMEFGIWERPDPNAGKVFRGKTFIPTRLGKRILSRTRFVNLTKTPSSGFLYFYEDGVFQRHGAARVAHLAQAILDDDSRKHRIEETVNWISIETQTDPEKANQHAGLINVKNGMLNWQTGELLNHSPDYLSTIQLPVDFDPEVRCPKVEEFLLTTLPGDCIETILEWLGYLLIPSTKHQKALMCTGSGENGKSTFLDLMEALLGRENVTNIPLQELSEHHFKRAELQGKLANIFADLHTAALKNSSYFKLIVAGDPIDAERKHGHPFTFRPFSRLIYSTNKMPIAYDRSRAYFRRWLIIPFPNRFEGAEADTDILAKMTTPQELSGLLNLAIEGLRRLTERGRFEEPETVATAMDSYQQSADPLVAFLKERCACDVPGAEVGKTELYEAYTEFCHEEGTKYVESRSDFNTRLQQQFPEMREARRRRKGPNPVWCWVGGPCLREDYQQEEMPL